MRPQGHFFSTNRCAQWIPDVILHPKKYSQAIFLNLAKKLTRPYRCHRVIAQEGAAVLRDAQQPRAGRGRGAGGPVGGPAQRHARDGAALDGPEGELRHVWGSVRDPEAPRDSGWRARVLPREAPGDDSAEEGPGRAAGPGRVAEKNQPENISLDSNSDT